jgi:signal transduction histidine kinase
MLTMKKILLIEDEQALREGIADVLTFEGYKVIEAADGRSGIEQAIKNLPDLILCDILMPEMNGHDVLRQLAKNEGTRLIPFVFITALSERPDIRTGMEMGANDYLTKPFTHEELLKTIGKQLEKSEEIRKQKEGALNELRSNIIYSLPHELRTPLTGLLGYGQLLMECPEDFDSSMIREAGQDIYSSVMRLNRLIRNYLMYAQLELNKGFPPQSFELNTVGEICQDVALKIAKEYNRQSDLEIEANSAKAIISEEEFNKIVEELTDNAFKFSVAGQKVKLKCWSDPVLFHLRIEDCGHGIPSEKIGKIGAYMQFDRRIYEQQGAGLGLFLAKTITEIYGGSFIIESEPAKGTLIEITLPSNISVSPDQTDEIVD